MRATKSKSDKPTKTSTTATDVLEFPEIDLDDLENLEPMDFSEQTQQKSGEERANNKKDNKSTVTPELPTPTDDQVKDPELRVWPKVPSFRLSWDVAEKFFEQFTKLHWCHFFCYMYRKKPEIIRPKGEGYIDKFSGSLDTGRDPRFNLDYIRDIHGGGTYLFVINNTDLHYKKQEACHISLDIPINQHEPKLNYRELDYDAKENKAYVASLIQRGILTADHKLAAEEHMNAQANVGDAIRATSNLVKDVLSMKESGGNGGVSVEVMRLLMDQTNKLTALVQSQKTEPSDVAKLGELIGMIGKIVAPQQNNNSGNTDVLAMMLKASMDQNTLLLTKLFERQATTDTKDPLDQMDKMITVFTKMSEKFGNKGDSESNPGYKPSTLETVLSHAPDILGPLSNIILGGLALKGITIPGMPTPEGSGVVPGIPMTDMQSTPTMQTQPWGPNQPIQKGVTQMPVPMPPNQKDAIKKQLVMIIGAKGQQIINAIYGGSSGADYADSVTSLLGTEAYAAIASLGTVELLAVFKSVPEFWQHLTTKEKQVVQFIDEFVNPDDDEEGVMEEGKMNATTKPN